MSDAGAAANSAGLSRPTAVGPVASAPRRSPAAVTVSPEAQRLVESCQGLVRSLAWKIHQRLPPRVEMDDLIAYGQLGLVQAARDFDASKGNRFTTYAYYRIRGAILDGLSQMSWFRRDEYYRGRYEHLAGDVVELHGQWHCEGDQPTSEKAEGDATSIDQDVTWLGESAVALSMVYLASDLSDESRLPDKADNNDRNPQQSAAWREIREKLHQLINSLPEDPKRLIRAAYFDGKTLEEAGKQIGISKAWASRLHARTLERLARGMRRAGAEASA